jgi:hypothetical protein
MLEKLTDLGTLFRRDGKDGKEERTFSRRSAAALCWERLRETLAA